MADQQDIELTNNGFLRYGPPGEVTAVDGRFGLTPEHPRFAKTIEAEGKGPALHAILIFPRGKPYAELQVHYTARNGAWREQETISRYTLDGKWLQDQVKVLGPGVNDGIVHFRKDDVYTTGIVTAAAQEDAKLKRLQDVEIAARVEPAITELFNEAKAAGIGGGRAR